MPLRQKRVSILLLAVVFVLTTAVSCTPLQDGGPQKPDPIPTGDYSYAGELARVRIEQLMKQHHIPGVSAVLIDDQQIVWQDSFGLADIEQEIPVTEDTIFKLWSLAKPFTAVETMRLVEEGQIDLDAPITEYIPDFTIHSRFHEGEPITIRRILAHRSGLPRNTCARPDWHYGADALDRLAESMNDCYLAYPTGERYKYSNAGYQILGYIIQDIREQPFPVYIHDHLLAPLGMEKSSFWSGDLFGVGKLDRALIATGYDYDSGQFYPLEQYDYAGIPSGNLYATVGDLADFMRFIFRGGQSNGVQIIESETVSAMFEEQYGNTADPQRLGLGWKLGPMVGSEELVWHDGGPSEGTGSLVAMLPQSKLGVILLANSTSFEGSLSVPLAIELLEAMSETAFGPVKVVEESPAEYELETADLETLQGDYAAMGQIMAVYLEGDQLKGKMSDLSFDLEPIGQNRFRLSHWLVRLGLDSLLSLPVDLGAVEIEFQPGQDTLIINFGDINYEFGYRYPDVAVIPADRELLAGVYDRYELLPSGGAGQEKLAENEITIVDGRLHMSGEIGPVLLIENDTIIILSGPFAGETITRDLTTGNLYHQGFVYKLQA